jgi:hypothetical protein
VTRQRPCNEEELVDLVRSIDVEAPPALRARVEQMVAAAPARGRLWRRPGGGRAQGVRRARPLAGALAGAVIAAVLIVALSSGGGGHTLNLRSAAAPTLLASTIPAPIRSDHSQFLTAAVGAVRFPYLEDAFGWRSSGSRTDTIDGRAVTTVFYSRGAARIGYAIYGVPSPSSAGGVVHSEGGTRYRVLSGNGAAIISWKREGHLCVMSGRGTSAQELIRLAGWDEGRSTA